MATAATSRIVVIELSDGLKTRLPSRGGLLSPRSRVGPRCSKAAIHQSLNPRANHELWAKCESSPPVCMRLHIAVIGIFMGAFTCTAGDRYDRGARNCPRNPQDRGRGSPVYSRGIWR